MAHWPEPFAKNWCLRHKHSSTRRFANPLQLEAVTSAIQEPRASKLYFAQPANEGSVYGSHATPTVALSADAIEQADNTAAMPIPFETLIPYGIIIAVSSRRAAARRRSSR